MDSQELLKRVKDKIYKSPQVDCKDLSCGICANCLYNELEQRLIELDSLQETLDDIRSDAMELEWKE